MKVKYKVFSNLYQDSVSLMQISAQISKLPGIQQASVVMGTPNNLEQLRDAGLGNEINASPNDLVIAVMGEEDICNEALVLAQQRLTSKPDDETDSGIKSPEKVSLEMALEAEPEANLALISVPGDYAAAEAIKALNLGMNVMMFSDNVSIVQEKSIKTLARERQRIVMGPDCGTAIVNGIPLGFANVVKRGAIGVIGASGTGLQEVTCRIDQLGAGISQALGTGGHDLSEEIGGISMLFALDALAQDDETRVIVLISKPPSPIVARTILERAEACGKPVVVNFLGANPHDLARPNITVETDVPCDDLTMLQNACQRLPAHRQAIRGVFAGGTFCYEAQLICQQKGFSAASNTPVAGNRALANIWQSEDHTLIDMGDDDFTRGKPHPMIDPTLRNQRLLNELNDSHTAVVLFDLVLGYGASTTPASELLDQLSHIDMNNAPLLIAHVCGTEADPQIRSQQISALQNAGIIIASSNAQAALWASAVAQTQLQKKGLNA